MARFAILSDIHGNLTALETVIERLQREQIDRYIVLGDVALFGPQPRGAVRLLQALKDPLFILGNTDHWMLHSGGANREELKTEADQQKWARMSWGYQQLSDEDRAFLASFQSTAEIQLTEALTLMTYHGSPRSFTENIYPDTPEAELVPIFEGISAAVCVGGHTHRPMLRRFQEKTLFNPGSVGLTAIRTADGIVRPCWAEYAVLEADGGQLEISLRHTRVDLERFAQATRESGMPFPDEFLADWKEME